MSIKKFNKRHPSKVIRMMYDMGTREQRKNGYTVPYVDDDGKARARARNKSLLDLYKNRGFISQEQCYAGEKLYSYWYNGHRKDHPKITPSYGGNDVRVPTILGLSEPDVYTHCCHVYDNAIGSLSLEERRIVINVAIHETPLSKDIRYTKYQCTKEGKAGKILHSALDELIKFFGM